MRLKPAMRKILREAFFTALPIAEIAKRKRIAPATIKRFWALEKAAGALPEARPHFIERCKSAAAPVPVEADLDDAPAIDKYAAPISAPNPRYEGECERSLAALRKHHAGLDTAKAHTAPAEWLRFDRKGERVPTHAELMAMARAYDQRARA